ncbi:hypothetical protein J437_LFUL009435 [Ladona fulva]|uniref:guanylate cyclase n=1 Tax=Ladona fulva TaxID=123851 RepID=A0A8K0K263_LADFU|nr:hypothetical protein J437_LFUL009435 [Ladona fulva]
MTWRVMWSEVVVVPQRGAGGGRGSIHSLAKPGSMASNSEDITSIAEGNQQVFIPIGWYKGCKVAIKTIKKNRIELTRDLLLELKRMKDLHHDHLVRFIGACVDPPYCCLLTEYCPRGSLQDVLENEQITLDWTFRYSLMHDIVKKVIHPTSMVESNTSIPNVSKLEDSDYKPSRHVSEDITLYVEVVRKDILVEEENHTAGKSCITWGKCKETF